MDLEAQHLTIHGHEVRYFRAGEGPAILLIHGMAGSASTWKAAMRLLARDYTVIAPDLLGHGRLRQAPHRLLARAPSPPACATCSWPRASSGPPSSASRSAAASPCSSPTSTPSRSSGWCWSAAAASGARSAPCCACSRSRRSEYVMPVVMNSYVRDAGNVGQPLPRSAAGCGPRRPRRSGRPTSSLCGGENRAGVHQDAALGRRHVGPIGLGPRPALPVAATCPRSSSGASATTSSRSSTPTPPTTPCPAAGSRSSSDSSHFPQSEEPERFAEVLRDFMETTEPAAARRRASWRADAHRPGQLTRPTARERSAGPHGPLPA